MISTIGFPRSIAIADMNGDGRLDVVTANGGYGTASVLLGNGAGAFAGHSEYGAGNSAISASVGDLNADGRLDMVVANSGASALSVILGLVPTRTTLTVSPGSSLAGAPVVLTANVSVPAPGTGSPADSVVFFDGTTRLGAVLLINGSSSYGIFSPWLGERTLTAYYKGDGKLFPSFSAPVKLKVASTAAATISSIADVKADQGGLVRVTFARSPFDYAGSGTPITGYQVYRRGIVAGATSVRPGSSVVACARVCAASIGHSATRSHAHGEEEERRFMAPASSKERAACAYQTIRRFLAKFKGFATHAVSRCTLECPKLSTLARGLTPSTPQLAASYGCNVHSIKSYGECFVTSET